MCAVHYQSIRGLGIEMADGITEDKVPLVLYRRVSGEIKVDAPLNIPFNTEPQV